MASAPASNATSRVVMHLGWIKCARPLVLTLNFKGRAWRWPPTRMTLVNRTNPRFRGLRFGLGREELWPLTVAVNFNDGGGQHGIACGGHW
jgi:hypothetical protein